MYVFSIVFILAYFLLLFLLSAFFVKRALNSYEEYAFCGRKLTIGFVIFTYLGTWVGGATIIGLAGSAYLNGVNQYWLFASTCIVSFIFAVFFISKIRKLKCRSIGDFFALRYPEYKEGVRLFVSLSVLVRNVTMVGMQFTALGYMITYMVPIDKNIAVLATFIIITGYTCLSGLWAVVSTDILQGFLQTAGLLFLLYLSVKMNNGIENIYDFYAAIGSEYKLNLLGGDMGALGLLGCLVCFGSFSLMGDQSDWERIYSCKTDKIAFWGYLIPLTITLMLLLVPAYIGVFQGALTDGTVQQEHLIYWFLFEKVSFTAASFILITIFTAVMSSADSYIVASGTIFSNEIIKRFLNKNANDRELIFWSRLGVIVSGSIGFAFAINIHNILLLWVSGLSIAAITILPEYLMAWFSRRMNTEGAIAGMIAGTLYCGILLLAGGSFQFLTILTGCCVNTAAAYVTSCFYNKPDIRIVERTRYFNL